jgi:hypothetical protein
VEGKLSKLSNRSQCSNAGCLQCFRIDEIHNWFWRARCTLQTIKGYLKHRIASTDARHSQRCQRRRRSTNRISRKTARLSRRRPVGFYQEMMPWTSSDYKGRSKALFMATIVSHKTRTSLIPIFIVVEH